MGIPKPLVQINQVFITATVLTGLLFHYSVLLIPFTVGIYTLITKQNPIILSSQRFLSKPMEKYIQEDHDQQIFNQWIATVCIGLATISFYFNLSVLGYIFSVLVVIAAGLALMGFCIGCVLRYRYMMWKYQRSQNRT